VGALTEHTAPCAKAKNFLKKVEKTIDKLKKVCYTLDIIKRKKEIKMFKKNVKKFAVAFKWADSNKVEVDVMDAQSLAYLNNDGEIEILNIKEL
jgi:hypothetical protein